MRARRLPVRDEVVRGQEAVVLVNGQVLRVTALAQSARELATDWVDVNELADHLAQLHGQPEGDPVELVRQMLAALEEAGLMELDPA